MNINIKIARDIDFDEYYMLRCDEKDVYWRGYNSIPDYETLRICYMQRIEGKPFSEIGDKRIYLIRMDKEVIGFVQLSIMNDGIELGYSVASKWQGKHIATKAIALAVDEAMGVSENIYVEIRDNNIASKKVALNNNFVASGNIKVASRTVANVRTYRRYDYIGEKYGVYKN